ncbi:ORF3 [Torque teno virus GB3_pi3]|nr:ORF3 [Torque teno virus GB3_pi3]
MRAEETCAKKTLECTVSHLPLCEPSVQLHPRKRTRKVRFRERKPRERRERKPRVRPVLPVPKAVLREMDRLAEKRRDELPESELSSYFSDTSETDPVDHKRRRLSE